MTPSETESEAAVGSESAQAMKPAPRLPSVAARHAEAERDAAEPLGLSPRAIVDPSAVAALHARASAVHRQFVEAQSEAQSAFLALMQRRLEGGPAEAPATVPISVELAPLTLSLATAPWLTDHRPTYTLAVLPLMSLVEILAATALEANPGLCVVGLENVRELRWIIVGEDPVEYRRRIEPTADGGLDVGLYSWREASDPRLSRYEPIGAGIVRLGHEYPPPPAPLPPLVDGVAIPDPYARGLLFHGPAFQLAREIVSGANGADTLIDAGGRGAPIGHLNPGLLDAAQHGWAAQDWERWLPATEKGALAFPNRVVKLTFHAPPPVEGLVRAAIRIDGTNGNDRLPVFNIQCDAGGRIFLSMRIVGVMTWWRSEGGTTEPVGDPAVLRRFVRDHVYVPDCLLSMERDGSTSLSDEFLRAANWVPGMAAVVYDMEVTGDVTATVAAKEHFARRLEIHPGRIRVEGNTALGPDGVVRPFQVTREGSRVTVTSEAP